MHNTQSPLFHGKPSAGALLACLHLSPPLELLVPYLCQATAAAKTPYLRLKYHLCTETSLTG